jgi:hypothetical protein
VRAPRLCNSYVRSSKKNRLKEDDAFAAVVGIPPPPPPGANKGKDPTQYTERRQITREEREVAIVTVFADEGGGGLEVELIPTSTEEHGLLYSFCFMGKNVLRYYFISQKLMLF